MPRHPVAEHAKMTQTAHTLARLIAAAAMAAAFLAPAPSSAADPIGDAQVVASFPGWELTAADAAEKFAGLKMIDRFEGDALAARALDHVRANAYIAWRDNLDLSELEEPFLGFMELATIRQDLGRLNILYGRAPLPENLAPSEERARAAFDERRDGYGRPAMCTFRFIMIRGTNDERKAFAEGLAAQIQQDPDSFAASAERFSESSLAPKSGVVGPTGEKGLLPAMADALFREMAVGDTSNPVALPTGFAILRLESRSEDFLPEWNDEWRARVLNVLEREARASVLQGEIDRLKAEKADSYEVVMGQFPGADAPGDAIAFRWAGQEVRLGLAKAFLAEQLIYPSDAPVWLGALESLRDLLAQRLALENLAGELSPEEMGTVDRDRARREQVHFARMAKDLPYTEAELDQVVEWLLGELRKASHFSGRVLYLRPAQRRENEERKVVPMADVLAEIASIRAEVVSGALPFDDAIQIHSTDEASKAVGGAVSTTDADLAPAIAKALRSHSIGELAEPIRLEDGFALLIVDKQDRSYPSDRGSLLWMADMLLPNVLRRDRQLAHQQWFEANLLKTDDAAIGAVALRVKEERMTAAQGSAEETAPAAK